MSCKHCDRKGECELYQDGIEVFGIDENGYCIVEDDEFPEDTCGEYEEVEE